MSYDPAWIESLTRLVTQLRGTGAEVLVLGPVPDPRSNVLICLSGHLDDATACASPRSVTVNEPGIAAETAATKAGGGQYADITALFCTADRCPVIVGNTLVYRNDNHLTAEYARVLGPVWVRWWIARSPAADLVGCHGRNDRQASITRVTSSCDR